MVKKKNYEASFKAKIAIEGIKNIKSSAEICSEHKIPLTNLYDWRNRLIYAFKKCVPEIFNTDQGSQFTSNSFINTLECAGVKISVEMYYEN